MKANESIPNFKPKLREYTNFAVRETKNICKQFGPRPTGEEGEKKAQEYMAEKLRECTDSVKIEPFEVHPHAFMAWVVFDGIALIAAVLAYNLLPSPASSIVSLVLTALSLIILVGEFLLYKKFWDFLFKKRTSGNVVAIRNPEQELKKRIILSAHTDSAYEWTYTYKGGSKLLLTVMIYAIVGLLYIAVSSVIGLAADEGSLTQILGYIQFAFVPGFIAVLFFTNFKHPVTGANDNLTGCLAVMAVMKYLSDNNIRFKDTEVRAVLTGGEEAGLRGAKAYAEAHLEECKAVETVFVGLDTLRDFEFMAIYDRDLSGTVRHDAKARALLKKASEIAGHDLPFSSVYLGASDAAAITQAKIPAVALAAMDPSPADYYHTRRDTEDILEPKTIEAALEITLETVFLFDEQGLAQ
ncbi:MAG: Zn-dependent exopeptidase M28 [Clostridiales bacterium]|nr:Zn-dependent exopeptidase M28 [Clostridiales bacterium]